EDEGPVISERPGCIALCSCSAVAGVDGTDLGAGFRFDADGPAKELLVSWMQVRARDTERPHGLCLALATSVLGGLAPGNGISASSDALAAVTVGLHQRAEEGAVVAGASVRVALALALVGRDRRHVVGPHAAL